MQHTDAEKTLTAEKAPGLAVSAFQGFRPPTSNTTYTPNQFFDVVIPNFSRGTVRIVAYLIRKTLGWCDANGNPQEEQIEASYSELEQKAGVSRDMIRQALDDALAGRLIECVRKGSPKLAQEAGQSAIYALRWSDAPYTIRPEAFQGFFEGEGNRTDIPNEFFDVVVPNETLSVIKVVGSIIRHSIGFQARHGRRRQQVALSFRHIQNYARIGSRSDLANAVRIASEKHYIVCLVEGVFSHHKAERRTATYALCWSDYLIGQKIGPAHYQSENQTSIGQKSVPANQSENRTSIKTKSENETLKQQQGTPEAVARLTAEGFDQATAKQLAEGHTLEEISQQIGWLEQRAPYRSKLGLLRKAIEEGWPAPQKLQSPEVLHADGYQFSRHFYAAFGGNRGEPVAEPSARDAELAGAFVDRLLKVSPVPGNIPVWGRELASSSLAQPSPLPALGLAIRQCGDGLLARLEIRTRQAREDALRHAKASHYAQYLPPYEHWLKDQEQSFRENRPDDFRAFEARRESERAKLASSHASWDRAALAAFDQGSSRQNAFRQYFGILEFWQWDAEFNNQPFKPII